MAQSEFSVGAILVYREELLNCSDGVTCGEGRP